MKMIQTLINFKEIGMGKELVIALQDQIRVALHSKTDLTLDEILKIVRGYSIGEVRAELTSMVRSEKVKQKEDSVEHDYLYRLIKD